MPTGSTFMDKGKQKVTGLIQPLTWYIAWGTGGAGGGAAVPNSNLSQLTAEASSNPSGRQTTTNTVQTAVVTGDRIQFVGNLTAAGTVTINEAGVFDLVTNGGPIVIGNFAGISLSSGDSITFTVQLTFS